MWFVPSILYAKAAAPLFVAAAKGTNEGLRDVYCTVQPFYTVGK